MAKFEFNEQAAMNSVNSGGGKKVLDSGVYPVMLNTVSETTASTGTTGFDWNFTVDGAQYPNIIYGMWTHRADGSELFNANLIQGLMGLLGLKTLTTYSKTIEIKDGTKTVTAVKELDDKKVRIAVQKVLDAYNGEPREKNEIKAFFDYSTGKTYAEMKNGAEAKQIKWYQTSMQDRETPEYKKWKLNEGVDDHDDYDVDESDSIL
jgi:hypothetical protein